MMMAGDWQIGCPVLYASRLLLSGGWGCTVHSIACAGKGRPLNKSCHSCPRTAKGDEQYLRTTQERDANENDVCVTMVLQYLLDISKP
jgi:hypothetical protein